MPAPAPNKPKSSSRPASNSKAPPSKAPVKPAARARVKAPGPLEKAQQLLRKVPRPPTPKQVRKWVRKTSWQRLGLLALVVPPSLICVGMLLWLPFSGSDAESPQPKSQPLPAAPAATARPDASVRPSAPQGMAPSPVHGAGHPDEGIESEHEHEHGDSEEHELPSAPTDDELYAQVVALGDALDADYTAGDLIAPPDDAVALGEEWDPLESTCRHASLSIL